MNQFIYGLHFNNIRGDIFGGLTAAVVALPLALAFGVSSGAGPVAGIYGAIFVGLFSALFGGTPAQVSGPTGPMTVVMAAVFTQYTSLYPDHPTTGVALAFTVVILGGLFQIVFGVLKLGKYINLVPHPVVSGFMSGIGIIIILLQLGPLLGHPAANGPLAAIQAAPQFVAEPNRVAFTLGLLALFIVYLLPKSINKIFPSPLLALIVGTLALYFYAGGEVITIDVAGEEITTMAGTSILGPIPTGLPTLQIPTLELDLLAMMVKSALMLAVLGSIDSLLTSLVADNITRSHHHSDRELIGQGIGNTISGLFGGLPGAGATMRTVVNVRAGGLTPLSGGLHALALLAIVLGAGPFAQFIPHAILAGILIKVGTDIIDWDYLKRLRSAPRAGILVMFTVLLVTVFVDLITAVAIGMVMASLIFMKRMTDLQLASIQAITEPNSELPLSPDEAEIMARSHERILLFHLGGVMSFGAAKGMVKIFAAFDQYDVMILDMSAVPQIDFTTSRAIDDMVCDTIAAGRPLLLVGGRPQVLTMLKDQRILQKIAPENCFEVRLAALQRAEAILTTVSTEKP
ncbi:MAG: SulP family inorganic anion transporter [Gammaproteobacteria bacterium]|nr:SulP family inorganic anion transporter [Gammaproteobacteria bacterium]